MKKDYTTPIAEKVQFAYKEQVVASTECLEVWTKKKGTPGGCASQHVSYND